MSIKTAMPFAFIEPCLPTPSAHVPEGAMWVHEIKHDGYRLIVRRDGEGVRLFTRRGHDWTVKYPHIVEAIAALRAQSMTLDGEAVSCGANGVSDFEKLHSPADGYTLLVVGSTAAINATLFEKLNYNFIRDIAPVASIVRVPHVMQVNPSLPVTTVPEFVTYAKANPGRISMGSGGNGSPAHVTGELFKMMAGVNLVHVPYRGAGPALTDLLGGQIQVTFNDMPASIEYIRTGKLRALAVTTATRSEALPDIPTVGDFVPGFEASQWVGLCAPKNTPSEIVGKLNREINAGLADPKLKARFADLGGTILPGSSAYFGKLIADDTEKWAKVIKFSGAKNE
jgi:tripartite-type tricarboxylate transporter receptor subunit TctC